MARPTPPNWWQAAQKRESSKAGVAMNGTLELHGTWDEEAGGEIGPKWLIDEVMEQTHLLALNAAIEAAHRLGEDDRALGRAWHVPNAPAVPLGRFIEAVFEGAGHQTKATYLPRAVTRAALPLMGLAVPPVRGLAENLYQTYEPFVADDRAYKAAFGDHATPLQEGIETTLMWLRGRQPT